jgi:hypothetical protein
LEYHIFAIFVGWELESADVVMQLLYSNLPSGVEEDRMGWSQSKNSKFEVRSFYEAFRGMLAVRFLWKSI